ncbi:MAG: response regulator [candidate division NC10 bacterium]|nr:response regulator [candidate division NC10 bacterium]
MPLEEPRRPKILVVDDNVANVELLEAYLSAAGYQVEKAYDGEEALETAAREVPDLVLLDIMMPKLDGYQVCQRLKGGESTRFVPVVMITALKELEDKIRAIETGADDFLTKPFNRHELLTRVKSLLRIKGLHDEVEAYNRLLEEKVAERTAELQMALEELRELDQMKSNFLATLSHELRTPLTPIKGYVQAMLSEALGTLSPGQRKGLGIVSQSVDRLHGLIEDLLAFVKMDQGEISLDRQAFPIDSLIRDKLNKAMAKAQEKEITLKSELPPDLPLVLADPDEIGRALSLLLDNAVKFTPSGGSVTVTAIVRSPMSKVRSQEDGASELVSDDHGLRTTDYGPFVEISVHDTGIGIPPDKLGRIFERFFQVDSSATREHGGVGIGLAIVKQIVEAHGSNVEVKSQEGVGSTFSFRLPLAPP